MKHFTLSVFADEISPVLDVQIAAVKRAGIQYIEARGLDHISVSDLTVAQALEMKKRLDEGGIKLSSLGSPLGKVDVTLDFVPHYNKFLHTLELAQIFECPYIRMFSFYYPKGHRPEEYRNLVMERWFRFVEAAKDLPVTLLHENELDIYGDNAARCLDILSTIRSPKLRAVFDPANFVLCPQEVYPAAFDLLADYIEYVHIKDALYQEDKVVPAGAGEGRVKDLLASLQKRDFHGFLSIEPHLGAFGGLRSIQSHFNVADLPDSDEGLFLLAKRALCEILDQLGEEY